MKVENQNSESMNDNQEEVGKLLSRGTCERTGTVELTNYTMSPDDFRYIIPYGLMVGEHVTPIDHQYFEPMDKSLPRDTYEVYAMADGKIVEIQEREHGGEYEYKIVFIHTCTFFTYYDLVTKLTPEIETEFDLNKTDGSAALEISVEGGEQIGWIGTQTLDFAVWNTETPLEDFVVPEHYESELWKIYTADPYQYYSKDILQTMMDKSLTIKEPMCGKIDYDQDGKLIGNWFLEGSGVYGGSPQQHVVKDPTPHPTAVSRNSGLVKYELFDSIY